MKNLKLELFNFKKDLSYDQSEIYNIVESHLNACDMASEKQVILSLNEKLKTYTYNKEVVSLLESFNTDMKQYELLYELKNLYNVLNSQNQGELYRHPINVLLQTINLDTDQDRMSKVLNELAIFSWVPEIRLFVSNLTKSPESRTNLLSGGKSNSVYTIVDRVEEGFICLIKNSWFLLAENNIEKTLLENHVKDTEKLAKLRNLQTAMAYATITEDKVNFKVSEDLTIGISTDKKGVIFINDEEMKETTLENLFMSPIIPIVNKNFYPLIIETAKNTDKIIELDVVKKVNNLINPHLEVYAFNYKNNTFLYSCDERYGYSLFQYPDALSLVNEVKNTLNYDLTFFYEKELDKDMIRQRKLEDKEREIQMKIENLNTNIEKLDVSIKYVGESIELTTALTKLTKRKENLKAELVAIKEIQHNERIKL